MASSAPAYAMYGDHYDWAVTGDQLTVTVLNGHGDGIEAVHHPRPLPAHGLQRRGPGEDQDFVC